MTPPDSPGYLPPERAAQIRAALVDVAQPTIRSMVLGACEAAFADGYATGYDRGFADGAAEQEAQTEAMRGENPPPRRLGPVTTSGVSNTVNGPESRPLPRIPEPGETAYQAIGQWGPRDPKGGDQ